MKPVNNSTILYMEDDEDDVFLFREALRSFTNSFYLLTAKDGEEGLGLHSRLKQTHSLPCLIVLDVNMPRMDGKTAFEHIQADPAYARIPVVVFSTSTNCRDTSFFEGTNVRYVPKHYGFSHFLETVKRFLDYCRL